MLSQADEFESKVMAALPMLRRMALGLVRDHSKADDLVQDTVVRSLAHRDKFEVGTNLNAWLATILKNQFRSGFRKGRRSVEDPDEMMAKAVPFEDSPLKKLEVVEMLRLIDMMPDAFRIPLRMVADGASYEEIAIELHEHVGTIKSRINRGRELLRAAG